MSRINNNYGFIFMCKFHNPSEVRCIGIHRIKAFSDNEKPVFIVNLTAPFQYSIQMVHIVMIELEKAVGGEFCSNLHTIMSKCINYNGVFAVGEAGNCSKTSHPTGRKDEGRVLLKQICQLFFQFTGPYSS